MPNSTRTPLVTHRICIHIQYIDERQMFTNRDFLPYGARGTVDQVLHRLVKRGLIIRLVRGVYIKAYSRIPSPHEIAKFKASVFSKNIVQSAEIATDGFELINNKAWVYFTNGCTSSFKYENIRIHFKRKAARKLLSGTSRSSKIIKALWNLGQTRCTDEIISRAISWLRRPDRKELSLSVGLMPGWMHKKFGLFRDDNYRKEYFFYKMHLSASSICSKC